MFFNLLLSPKFFSRKMDEKCTTVSSFIYYLFIFNLFIFKLLFIYLVLFIIYYYSTAKLEDCPGGKIQEKSSDQSIAWICFHFLSCQILFEKFWQFLIVLQNKGVGNINKFMRSWLLMSSKVSYHLCLNIIEKG